MIQIGSNGSDHRLANRAPDSLSPKDRAAAGHAGQCCWPYSGQPNRGAGRHKKELHLSGHQRCAAHRRRRSQSVSTFAAKLSPAEIAFIDSLEAQHVEAGSIYSELKRLALAIEVSGDPSPGLLGQYRGCAEQLRSLYRRHIQSEDEISQQWRADPLMTLKFPRSPVRCAHAAREF